MWIEKQVQVTNAQHVVESFQRSEWRVMVDARSEK